jgi:hypothetical protein
LWTWRMSSFGMWRRVALVRTDVSEKLSWKPQILHIVNLFNVAFLSFTISINFCLLLLHIQPIPILSYHQEAYFRP